MILSTDLYIYILTRHWASHMDFARSMHADRSQHGYHSQCVQSNCCNNPFLRRKMKLIHRHGCVTSSPENVPIVHAVSMCGKMGAGAAKTLDDNYQIRSEFRSVPRNCPGVVPVQRGPRLIINVITKLSYFEKPTEHQIYVALSKLRDFLNFHDIRVIAITVFGCGRDKFPYQTLMQYLWKIFGNSPVEFHMYHF